jgi:Raf kinase inhibitor-like YbhB/YbcL family protein
MLIPEFPAVLYSSSGPDELRKENMMKTTQMLLLLMMSIWGAGIAGAQAPAAPAGPGLTLSSPAFADGGVIPNKFSQADPNFVSPKLEWTNVPPNTASFVLMTIDPDTALQKTTEEVVHWLVFNIPGAAHELPEAMPKTAQLQDGAIQGKNRRGEPGYLGMGAGAAGPYHHYTFQLFALDSKLELGPDATRADVDKAMAGHILAKAVLVGRFHR